MLYEVITGGSPSGTAGGIKTVTFAVLIYTTFTVIKGKQETEMFHRKLDIAYGKKAFRITSYNVCYTKLLR